MNLLSRFGGRIWDPWREMGQLQHEMGRLFNGARNHAGLPQREYPPVNLYVNDQDVLLTLEVPGIDPAHLDVTVTAGAVSLAGGRPAEAAKSGESFHRNERPSGEFRRSIELPFEVDPTRTEASYENGVLSVKMARPETQKPRKVSVKLA